MFPDPPLEILSLLLCPYNGGGFYRFSKSKTLKSGKYRLEHDVPLLVEDSEKLHESQLVFFF